MAEQHRLEQVFPPEKDYRTPKLFFSAQNKKPRGRESSYPRLSANSEAIATAFLGTRFRDNPEVRQLDSSRNQKNCCPHPPAETPHT